MTAYWLLFLYPLLGQVWRTRFTNFHDRLAWGTLVFVWVLVIGFRIEIGCDWDGYLQLYNNFRTLGDFGDLTLADSSWFTLFNWDPGYVAITWISAKLGFGIYGVNIACGALIVFGLSAFCRKIPLPWLAWLIATPYFLTVVTMGYSRQAVAVGLLFWGLSFLIDNRRSKFIAMVLLAALFHKTAVFLLPIGILPWLVQAPRFLLPASILFFLSIIWVAPYLANYLVKSPYYSDGASVRVLLNGLPAILLILLRKQWPGPKFDYSNSWFLIALASITSIFLVWFATTAIDRIGIYFLPIQVYVWSTLPSLSIVKERRLSRAMTAFIVLLYGLTFFVLLNFAYHKECWVPYRNLLLDIFSGNL